MSFLETLKQVITPGASYPMVRLFPGGPIGNDVGLNPAATPDGNSVPEPQVGPSGARPGSQDGGRAPLGPTKPDTSLRGAVGTANFAGFLVDLGEYNPKLEGRTGLQIYEKMRRSDADVAAALLACKLPIRAAESQIVPGVKENEPGFALAKQLAEEVKENLLGGLESPTSTGAWVTQNFETVKENALLCLDFGCAAHEDLWHIDGDKVRLRKLSPRLPLTFYRYHIDDDGETLLFLEQYGYRGNNFVNVLVPAEKLCYFVNQMEGAYFFGRSVLRAAYQHWYMKSQIYRLDAISIERNGLGVPTIKQGPNPSAEDVKSSAAWAKNLSANEQTSLALPNGWDFALQGITGRVRDPKESIQHHSEMIMRSVLANFLTLGTTQSGSRALGGTMRDFFYLSLEAISRRVDDTITNTSIRRRVDYNYNLKPDQKNLYPRLITSNIIVVNPLELLEVAKDVAKFDVDLIQPDDDTENWIRKKAGLPLKSKTPRVRWSPIVQRVQEEEQGKVPLEPGEKLDASGKPIQGTGEAKSPKGKGSSPAPSPEPPAPSSPQRHGDTEAAQCLSASVVNAPRTGARPRSAASPYWDGPVHENEAHVDWRAHDREISRAQDSVARVLKGQKKKTIRSMANHMANALKGGQKPSDVVFPHDDDLQAKVHAQLARVHQFGADQARAEHARLMKTTETQRHGESQTLSDSVSQSLSGGPGLHAEITVQDYTNRLADATKNAANDLRRSQDLDGMDAGEIADLLFGAVDDYSEGFIDRAAQESVRGAMADGRTEGFEDSQDELANENGFYERSCLLDKNTCDPCERHDGDRVEAEDGPPADAAADGICEGGPECRCTWYEVIRQALANA